MTRQNIFTGSNANDGTGDDLRSAFIKVNENFTELYAASTVSHGLAFSGNKISTNSSNANLTLEASGSGVIELEGLQFRDNHIEATRSNDDLILGASGTGDIVLGAIRISGSSISSDDSTGIKINDILNVSTLKNDDSTAIAVDSELHVLGTLKTTTLDTNFINSEDSTAITFNDSINVNGSISANFLDINNISSGDSSAVQIEDSVNINGTLTVNGGITGLSVLNHATTSDGTTTVANSTTTAINSFAHASFRSARYLVSVSDSTNTKFEVHDILITHNGTTAFMSTNNFISHSGTDLCTFDAVLTGSNVELRSTNGGGGSLVYKFVRTVVNV